MTYAASFSRICWSISVRASVGPDVDEILGPQARERLQEARFAGSESPRLLLDPDGHLSADDAGLPPATPE